MSTAFKRKTWSRDGMHQTNVCSGVKAFDQQVSAIGYGNVIGSTQTSFFIRPYTETECNYHTFAPGYLRSVDLGYFGRMPERVHAQVERLTATDSVILYHFFHNTRRKRRDAWYYTTERVSDCWLVTDYHGTKLLFSHFANPCWRRAAAIHDAVLPFIVKGDYNTEAQHGPQ